MDNTKSDNPQPDIDQRQTFVRFIKRKHRDTSGYIELRPCFEYRQGTVSYTHLRAHET